MRIPIVVAAAFLSAISSAARGQCGGEQRWPVKMAADTAAGTMDLLTLVQTPLHTLAGLDRPNLPNDDLTRRPEERTVRVLDAHLIKFKKETGKTGDLDYHLVISDALMLFSPGGSNTTPSPHSLIAEIPDPACVAGREGDGPTPSRVQAQLAAVRATFEAQFTSIKSGWNEAEGIPVRLTGIGFFDHAHGQVGRAENGLELHPLLNIEFNPPSFVPPPSSSVALVNPGFEDTSGWTATDGVITTGAEPPPHAGSGKAWLGGLGTSHTDRVSQQVTLPTAANARAIALTFFLHVSTEESGNQAFDSLRVRVRRPNGTLIRTVAVFTNVHAEPNYTIRAVDLREFRGQTIRISFEAKEDNGSITSFVIDDVAIRFELP